MLYISLLNNITLLVSLSIIHGLLLRYLNPHSFRFRTLSGLLFGLVAIIGMLNSVEVLPGIIFDGRSIILVTAGVFGGPVAGGLAILISSGYRIFVGGAGTLMGVLVIAESGILGILYHFLRKRLKKASNPLAYYLLGLLVHVIMLVLSYSLPAGAAGEVLPKILIPVLLIFPVATLLLFLFFQNQESYSKLVKELSESEAALNESNSIAGIGRWNLDSRNNSIKLSETIYDIFELERNKQHMSLDDFLESVHPDDKDFVKEIYRESIDNRSSYEIEYRLLMKDGRVKWLVEKGRTDDDQPGHILYSSGVIQEITDRKLAGVALEESRQMLRLIIDTIPVRVFWKGKDNKYLGCNMAFANDAGYAKPEDLAGMDDYKLAWKEQADLYRKMDNEVINSGKPVLKYEEPQTTPDGKTNWLQSSKVPLTDIDGKIIGVLGVYEDITRRKQMENDLIIARDKAQESDRLKTSFLNNLSHEIRTPLNAIVGFSELLDRKDAGMSDIKSYTQIITSSSNQLLAIIDDIFDIAAIEAGQVKLSYRKVNVNILLTRLIEQFQIKAAEKGLKLVFEKSCPDSDAFVTTDDIKLSQVLNNLIANSVKFTKSGMICFGFKERGNELLFYVKDTGPGIPSELHEKIFGKFVQGNLKTGDPGGSGLGLFISRSYISLLGGNIWLKSEPGTGSEFYFTIPGNTVEGQNEMATKEQKILAPGNKTILIAEDNSINYLLLEEFLSAFNFTLIHAWNGKEAADICKNNDMIDIILMDIKMPVMDGLKAAGLIKAFKPELPVIALTAYAQSGDREKFLLSGCDDYLSKPFNTNELVNLLNKYLAR